MSPLIALVFVAASQLQPLPENLIPLNSDEGRRLLVESDANQDFFALSSQFVTQQSTSFCGVASAVMALNAMPIAAPEAKEFAPWRAFTQENVFNTELAKVLPAQQVSRGGLTLDGVVTVLRQNQADATAVFATETTLEKFRTEVATNMKTPNDFVLVDFLRSELKQDTGAHWSPVAAYHVGSDRFLVLDVARFRYPPYWVKAEELFKAMATGDLDSGKSRGYVVTRPAKDAAARVTMPPVQGRMLRFAIGAGGLVFLLGVAVGSLVTRSRMKRRAAAS